LTITVAANFDGILNVRSQNSSCEILVCVNSSSMNSMTIKSGKNAAVLRRGYVISAN